ncbi:MAG TPA: hypothetical protein VHO02_08055, partial [Fibrobacteria bacterium]|nr:hypothetical protein [Fibrobacteria bacterium]
LRPEETRAASVFASLDAGVASLRATAFANLYADPIRLRAHGASPFLRHENGADYDAVGVEARATVATRLFEGAASATLQRTRIGEGLYAGNSPAYESPLEGYAEAFVRPYRGVRVGPVARYSGPYYPGDPNVYGTRRPGEWEWDAHASVERAVGSAMMRVAVDARNLTDRKTRDFAFSPRSGRSGSLTLSVEI